VIISQKVLGGGYFFDSHCTYWFLSNTFYLTAWQNYGWKSCQNWMSALKAHLRILSSPSTETFARPWDTRHRMENKFSYEICDSANSSAFNYFPPDAIASFP